MNDPITQEVPVVVADPTATGPLHTGAGWTSPDSTGVHEAVRTVPAELSRQWKRSSLGQARGVQQHAPRTIGSLLITTFRLETFDAHRGRQPGHPVRLRGQGSVGFAGEGDWVEMKGLRLGGVVRGWAGINHSTGARYRYPTRRPLLLLALLGLLLAGLSLARDAAAGGGEDIAGGPTPTLGATPSGPPATTGSDEGGGTGDQQTGSETESTGTTTFDPGDPEAPALPEHRQTVIGPAGIAILQEARDRQLPWSEVVVEHLGSAAEIEALPPEHRADFLNRFEPTRTAMQTCLEQTGQTWAQCAEPLVGTVSGGPSFLRWTSIDGVPPTGSEPPGVQLARCVVERWNVGAPSLWQGCAASALAGYYYFLPVDENGFRYDPASGTRVDPANPTAEDVRFRDCRARYNAYAATYAADFEFVDCVNR
jgi:hypothetical protein